MLTFEQELHNLEGKYKEIFSELEFQHKLKLSNAKRELYKKHHPDDKFADLYSIVLADKIHKGRIIYVD